MWRGRQIRPSLHSMMTGRQPLFLPLFLYLYCNLYWRNISHPLDSHIQLDRLFYILYWHLYMLSRNTSMHESLTDKAIRRGWLIGLGVHDNKVVSCLVLLDDRWQPNCTILQQYYCSDVLFGSIVTHVANRYRTLVHVYGNAIYSSSSRPLLLIKMAAVWRIEACGGHWEKVVFWGLPINTWSSQSFLFPDCQIGQ